ncbi:ion channel [Pelagibacterium montanilacus]|uniref:ion channel n=1 Tax=Pelagibacterium montanilacus TaxID=2185280 RepID=UPI0019D2B897|nr:ion channel [Pelagibacterium montanilacus]
MLTATVISGLMVGFSLTLHFQAMMGTRALLSGSGVPRHFGALLGMCAMFLAQIVSIFAYACVYWAAEDWLAIGGLEGERECGFIDPFYFSLMSYTTLGVGDIYPTGAFRVLSGIQALNGFALIGWTASFAYTLMRNGPD